MRADAGSKGGSDYGGVGHRSCWLPDTRRSQTGHAVFLVSTDRRGNKIRAHLAYGCSKLTFISRWFTDAEQYAGVKLVQITFRVRSAGRLAIGWAGYSIQQGTQGRAFWLPVQTWHRSRTKQRGWRTTIQLLSVSSNTLREPSLGRWLCV